MQKITPCLWFDTQAEEAAKFYTSIFKNSKIKHVIAVWRSRQGIPREAGRLGDGRVVRDQRPGVHRPQRRTAVQIQRSRFVPGDVRVAGGSRLLLGKAVAGRRREAQACGWLKDKFGVSWQITPTILPKLIKDKDPAKGQRVMAAMMKMIKIDIAGLQKAYDG